MIVTATGIGRGGGTEKVVGTEMMWIGTTGGIGTGTEIRIGAVKEIGIGLETDIETGKGIADGRWIGPSLFT